MERKDVMSKNVSIYKSQAAALEKHAAPNCKVLVVANPERFLEHLLLLLSRNYFSSNQFLLF
jgi:malate/lactate dehydrogenase